MAMKPEPQQIEVTTCVCGHRYEQHASRDYGAYCHTACGCTKYVCAEQPEPLPPPERIWIPINEAREWARVTVPAAHDIQYARVKKDPDAALRDAYSAGVRSMLGQPAPVNLRAALQMIVDGDRDCTCEHNNENCCVVVKEYCPFCIASVALAEQPLPTAPQADRDIQIPPPGHVKFTKQGRAYVEADHLTDLEVPPTPQHDAAGNELCYAVVSESVPGCYCLKLKGHEGSHSAGVGDRPPPVSEQCPACDETDCFDHALRTAEPDPAARIAEMEQKEFTQEMWNLTQSEVGALQSQVEQLREALQLIANSFDTRPIVEVKKIARAALDAIRQQDTEKGKQS